jgi:hypothetical protein
MPKFRASLLALLSVSVAPRTVLALTDQDRPTETPPESAAAPPVRYGAIGGIGFPRALAIEAIVRVKDLFAFGVEYGVIPGMTIDGVHGSMWSLAGDLRYFPFGGAFFIGTRIGRQHLGGDALISLKPLGPATEDLGIDSWYVNPQLGLLWTWSDGVSLGFEAGVQIPLGVDVTSNWPLSLVPGAEGIASNLGSKWLPTLDLLRIGFMF